MLIGAVPTEPVPMGQPASNGAGRPTANPERAARDTAATVIRLWRRIGLDESSLASQVVVTPACGLAGVSPARARAVLTQCQEAARLIPELMQEGVA
jgi:hypothetical protein